MNKSQFSRREALKTLAAAAGAVSLAHLPEQWAGPVTPDYGTNEYCGGDLGNSLYHVSFEIVFEKW